MAELADVFSRLPDELLNCIVLFSHTTASPNKRWKQQIEILIARTMKELQTITNDENNNNSGICDLKSYYLTLKRQAEKEIWNEVTANYSLLSSSFYQVLHKAIENTNLKIFWTGLDIDGKPNLNNAEEIRLWMNENHTLLANITSLNLGSKKLIRLPKQIGQLKQLQWLYLRDNQITQLPSEIGQLQQLQWLYLDNNQITQLPAEIGQLQQLRGLYLNYNQIAQLPIELSHMSQIIHMK